MVPQRPFDVVGVFGLRRPREQVVRELDHVVGVARLGGARAQGPGQGLLRGEHLAVAVPADDVGPLVDHRVPEEVGGGAEGRIARQLVLQGVADELGDLRVGVQAGQGVAPAGGRIEDRVVVEPKRQVEILAVAGRHGQRGQGLIDAAVLGAEHALDLFGAQAAGTGPGPVAEAAGDVECPRVGGVGVGVEQAGEDLVQGVPGGPHALAPLHAVDERLGEGAEVAAAELRLAFGQAGDDGVDPGLQALVAGGGIHAGTGRQVMADEVAPQLALRLLPTAIGPGVRR